jgi:CBS domain-containing protein
MSDATAAQIMTHPVVTIGPDALLTDAIKLLLRHGCSGLPVVDEGGKVIGIITEHDIMNFALSGNAADTRVEEAMTRDVVSLPPTATLASVINCLLANHFRRVPVAEDGRVVGIISRRDILREMLAMYSTYH